MLLQALKNIINQNGEGTSFFDYRMKMLNFPAKAGIIRKRIENFSSWLTHCLRKQEKKL